MNQSERRKETPNVQVKAYHKRRGTRRSEAEWMRAMSAIAFGLAILFAALVCWEFFGVARPALCLMFLLFSAVCFVTAILFHNWKRAVDREEAQRRESRERERLK